MYRVLMEIIVGKRRYNHVIHAFNYVILII